MFKGLGQMGDMGKMMKAAQEMQEKMAALQEEMHQMTVEGESGAGLVRAVPPARANSGASTSTRRSFPAMTRKWSRI